MYIARASEASGVDRTVLAREAGASPGRSTREPAVSSSPPPPDEYQEHVRLGDRRIGDRRSDSAAPPRAGPAVERYLLRVILAHPAYLEMAAEADVGPDTFVDSRYREIFSALAELGADANPETVVERLSSDAAAAYDQLLGEPPESIVDLETTYRHTIAKMRVRELKQRNAELRRLMAATRDKNEESELFAELTANSRKVEALQPRTT
jgi:hypothetical protein